MVKPTQLISFEKGKELNKNYNDKRGTLVTEKSGLEDANAFWFSIEELERYIAYVKENAVEKGYSVDGIRIYLGVYPETEEKNAGYTTVFLTPTGTINDEQGTRGSVSLQGNALDITTIEPLNFGSMGNPPKLNYGG